MVFPRKRPPTGYPMPSSQPSNHIHTGNTAQTEQVMLMYLGKHTLKISATAEWDPGAASLVVASPQAWLVPQQLQSIQKSWNVHEKLLVLNLIQISAKESSVSATVQVNWVPNSKIKEAKRMIFLVPYLSCSGCYLPLGWGFLCQLRQSYHISKFIKVLQVRFHTQVILIHDTMTLCPIIIMPSKFLVEF